MTHVVRRAANTAALTRLPPHSRHAEDTPPSLFRWALTGLEGNLKAERAAALVSNRGERLSRCLQGRFARPKLVITQTLSRALPRSEMCLTTPGIWN